MRVFKNAAIRSYAEGFSARSGVSVSAEVHDELGCLPQDIQLLAKLAEVRQLQEKNKIRFEWVDNQTIEISGVTAKFRELGGIAAFSEFLLTRWKAK